jgi:uncharacterized protein (TIGR02145 family)
MYRLELVIFLGLTTLLSFSQSDILTDNRDGQTYKTIIIGNQTWMAENLNYATPDSWCYADSTSNCKLYGRLYTWDAAMKACPEDWHLPTDEEWKSLEQYIGMSVEEADIFLYRGEGKGIKLMNKIGWTNTNSGNPECNTIGFDALPSGFRLFSDGSFMGKGNDARWWTSTTETWKGNIYAFRRCIVSDRTGIDRDAATLTLGFSVRCIKNSRN